MSNFHQSFCEQCLLIVKLLTHLLISELLENVLESGFLNRETFDGRFMIVGECQQFLKDFSPFDIFRVNEILENALLN